MIFHGNLSGHVVGGCVCVWVHVWVYTRISECTHAVKKGKRLSIRTPFQEQSICAPAPSTGKEIFFFKNKYYKEKSDVF